MGHPVYRLLQSSVGRMFRPAGFSDGESSGGEGGGLSCAPRPPPPLTELRRPRAPPSTWLPLAPQDGGSPDDAPLLLGLQRAIEEDDQEVVESCLPVLGVSCRLPGVGGPSPAMLAASLGRATTARLSGWWLPCQRGKVSSTCSSHTWARWVREGRRP